MNSCYNNISSYSNTIDVKPANINSLPENLEIIFKKKAQIYSIDWKWLAAIAWVESKWRTNAVNDDGYSGLFQWHRNCKDINSFLDKKTTNIFNVNDQTEATAKRFHNNVASAIKKGLSGEDRFLYASICHNAGEGGAQIILNNSQPKTVRQMSQTILVLPSSKMKTAKGKTLTWMATPEKRKEISEYPFLVKSAYKSISAKYS